MLNNNIFKIFVIAIFVIGTVSLVYADSGPTIGENQAKSIAKEYLSSHNLPYKVTTATELMQIKNRKTGSTKWVTISEWDSITGGNKFKPDEDPTFEWEYGPVTYNKWKITTEDSQGKGTGSIWVNAETGAILKTSLKSTNQNTDNQNSDSNQTPVTSNITSPTPDTSGSNTWIILGVVLLVAIIGAGYWFYSRR